MNIKYITKDLKDIRLTPDIESTVEKKLTQRFKNYNRGQNGQNNKDNKDGKDGNAVLIRISEKRPYTRIDMEMPYLNYRIHAEAESTDGILTCVDKCADIIDRQIAKYKTRIHRSRVRRGELKKDFLDIVTDDELITPSSAESNSEDTADGSESEYNIIKVENYKLKPMDVEEAVLQMEVLEFKFLFFFNTETNSPGVVYKRDDGNIGLIES